MSKKETTNKQDTTPEEQLNKELKTEDNIVTRHTNKETKMFNFGAALLELESSVKDRDMIIGRLEARVSKLEDAMQFFAEDWSKRFGNSIIIPTNGEINSFKK